MFIKKWLVKKLLKWARVLNVDKAIRDAYQKGGDAREKKLKERVNIWIDPTVRVDPHFHVQPAPVVPNPRGRYFKAHHLEFMPEPVRTNTEPIDPTTDFPAWLTEAPIAVEHMTPEQIERVPTIHDLTDTPLLKDLLDEENTEEMQATVALLHQRRHVG